MNPEQIAAMSDAEVDAAIAEQVMGWRVEQLHGHLWLTDRRQFPRRYHDDLNACHAAEERLDDMGLATAFTVQLYLVAVEAQKADGRRHPIRWYEVHAPALERARAILLAAQKEN